MTVIFALIFVSSLILGFIYAWVNQIQGFVMVISIIVGGFFGSCLVAVLFTYLYFFHEETDKKKILRLKQEINQFKKEK